MIIEATRDEYLAITARLDAADSFPRRGTPYAGTWNGGGRHVSAPDTWDGTGRRPRGWVRSHRNLARDRHPSRATFAVSINPRKRALLIRRTFAGRRLGAADFKQRDATWNPPE